MTKGRLSTLFLIALLLSAVYAKDSFLVLKGTSEFSQTSIPQNEVADLISHVSGLSYVHSQVDRTGFPKTDILNLPKANVLVVLDSVSGDLVETLSKKQFLDTTNSIEIVKTAFPEDSLAFLTSLVSGEDHHVHGIAGHSWKANDYLSVSAFEVNGQSQVPNLADRISHESKGAKTFVFGGHKKFASAMGVHSELAKKNFDNVIHYNPDKGLLNTFTKQYIASMQDIKADARKKLMKLETKEGHLLAAELYAIENIHKFIGAAGSSDLDFIGVGITSIKALTLRYGSDSAQVKAALEFIDSALAQMEANLNALYDSKVVLQVVGVGHSVEEHNSKTQDHQVRKMAGLASNDNEYSITDVSAFQTQFWVALVLIITFLVGFLALVKMDMLYDSLLYKTTDGPRPIQNVK